MDLAAYLDGGVRDILDTAGKFYFSHPRGLKFLAATTTHIARASRRRRLLAKDGLQVPIFLIASIASECNLNCVGCYARKNGAIGPEAKTRELTDDEWRQVFDEAEELGVSFILLAGGEPTLRRPVIEEAARHKSIIFPVFTNGLLLDGDYLELFDNNRNMVPVFSLEGDGMRTDARRGPGVTDAMWPKMEACKQRRILWGASITVTTENIDLVTSDSYVASLHELGCGLIVYVEYVPVDSSTRDLALDREASELLLKRIDAMHSNDAYRGTMMVAFPGGEEIMGGCLAAGRGFFHIAQDGAAEPCPFSPFSVANVRDVGLKGALRSSFFKRVQTIENAYSNEHEGGCMLFMHADEVQAAVEQAIAEMGDKNDVASG